MAGAGRPFMQPAAYRCGRGSGRATASGGRMPPRP